MTLLTVPDEQLQIIMTLYEIFSSFQLLPPVLGPNVPHVPLLLSN